MSQRQPDTEVAVQPVVRRRWLRSLSLALGLMLLVTFALALWVLTTQSGLRTGWSLAQRWVPSSLQVAEVSGTLMGPLHLSQIRLATDAADVQIAEIEWRWQWRDILSSQVSVELLQVNGVHIQLKPTAESESSPPELPTAIDAPFDIELRRVLLTDVQLFAATQPQADGAATDPLLVINTLYLRGHWIGQQVAVEQLAIGSSLGSLSATGSLQTAQSYPLTLAVKHQLSYDGYPRVDGQWQVAESLKQPRLTGSLGAPYNLELAVDIVNVFDQPSAKGELSFVPAPLTQIRADLPPATVGGQLSFSGTMEAYDLKLAADVDYLDQVTPISLRAKGTAENLSVTESRFGVGGGEVAIVGQLDWHNGLAGELQVQGTDLDPGIYQPGLPGNLGANAQLNFRQTANVPLNVQVPSLALSGELLGEPLRLDGQLSLQNEQLRVDGLVGRWAGNEFNVDGNVGASTAPASAELKWQMGLADLSKFSPFVGQPLAGSLVGKGQLSGRLQSPTVLAELRGDQIALAGTVIGKLQLDANINLSQVLDVELLLSDLQLGEQHVEQFALTSKGTPTAHDLRLRVNAPEFSVRGFAQGALPDLSDLGSVATTQWQFTLTELLLEHVGIDSRQLMHKWALEAPAPGQVELASGLVKVEALCLRHQLPAGDGRVCAQLGISDAQEQLAELQLDDLLLQQVNGLLPENLNLSGVVNGELRWAGTLPSSTASLNLLQTKLAQRIDGQWQDVMQFATGNLSLQPVKSGAQDSAQVALRVALPLVTDPPSLGTPAVSAQTTSIPAGIHASLDIGPGTGPSELVVGDWSIEGDARVHLPHLAWLNSLLPAVENLNASLVGDLSISGTLNAPIVEGRSTLSLPRADLTQYGVSLRDTELQLLGDNQGLVLTGTSRSGEGQMQLRSRVVWQEGLRVEGSLQGENFTLSDTFSARVKVSPDLTALFADNQLTLTGEMVVPVADLRLAKIPQGAVGVSRDQRFKDQPLDEAPLDTDIRLRLVLGDDVRFDGLGLNAQFGGDMTLIDKSNQVTTATGEIQILSGTYQAYGQDLRVENGKVLFAGGPLGEPGLDVRATRQATPEVEVGVQVLGSLQQPRLTLFSSPSLPESDQLSYLVLGRPLAASSEAENSMLQQAAMAIGVEGGQLLTNRLGKGLGVDSLSIESAPGTSNAQAALVVGKYLSPKLYVSYGYGLFEPLSTIRLEYEMSRLWRLVTESSNEATGGDLRWVLEK